MTFHKRKPDGLFELESLQAVADSSVKALGKEFSKMSIADKKATLDKLRAKEVLKKIKKKLKLD